MTKQDIWERFCEDVNIKQDCVPLFDAEPKGAVRTKEVGKRVQRSVLCRSRDMDDLIVHKATLLVNDWEDGNHRFDGLIYMMLTLREGRIFPFYIGKAETLGKGKGNLSANIVGVERDKSKFARWGDGYAYHIGDLSAVVLPGHAAKKKTIKYTSWANALFEHFPTKRPILKQPVYFWAEVWDKKRVGIWHEFGATRLGFLEYLMIGVASSLFPDTVLNREGQSRKL